MKKLLILFILLPIFCGCETSADKVIEHKTTEFENAQIQLATIEAIKIRIECARSEADLLMALNEKATKDVILIREEIEYFDTTSIEFDGNIKFLLPTSKRIYELLEEIEDLNTLLKEIEVNGEMKRLSDEIKTRRWLGGEN